MSNEMSMFSNAEFGSVRVIMRDGEPWFVAKDVAQALGYPESSLETIGKLFGHVPPEWADRKQIPVRSESGVEQLREVFTISEPGLYFFLGRSDKPKALPYQKWVAGDVMPSIRKTGSYSAQFAITSDRRPLCDIAAIYEAAGLQGNQLALALDKLYKAESGMSALGAAGIELIEPKQDVHLNATQLGDMMGGVKARAVNKRLAAAGLQVSTPSGWRPTEFGRQYSVLLDTGKKTGNGTPVTQLKWYPTVLDIIA